MAKLEALQDGPSWLKIAMGEQEIVEIAGPKDNQRILEYLKTTSLPKEFWHDETAWCASFVNWCFKQCGIAGTNLANARSWLQWGTPLQLPRVGAVAIFSADSRGPKAGHVAFYMSDSKNHINVFGGNQNNRVCLAPYERKRLLGYRWPKMTTPI